MNHTAAGKPWRVLHVLRREGSRVLNYRSGRLRIFLVTLRRFQTIATEVALSEQQASFGALIRVSAFARCGSDSSTPGVFVRDRLLHSSPSPLHSMVLTYSTPSQTTTPLRTGSILG